MRNVFYLLLLVVMLAGCKSTKNITSSVPVAEPCYLSSKLQLTIPSGSDGSITPDEVLLIDRMNKRYVRASRKELDDILPKDARFSKLEKLLLSASRPEGKAELSGKELGIPSLERAKVRLYDFSSKEFAMTPTEISDRYTQVPLEELLNMLTKL